MNDDLEARLPQALRRLDRRAPTGPLDPARVRRTVRRRRPMIASPAAAVLAVAAILATVALTQPRGAGDATPPAGSACQPLITGAPPPEWARDGFSGDSFPPFAYSSSGDVLAYVFGDPLSAPPAADHNNKILWVVRPGAAPFTAVTARLEGTDRTITLQVPAGPSIVDVPAPGCWQLDLRSGDRHDRIALRWASP
jgi:hypothetical protein